MITLKFGLVCFYCCHFFNWFVYLCCKLSVWYAFIVACCHFFYWFVYLCCPIIGLVCFYCGVLSFFYWFIYLFIHAAQLSIRCQRRRFHSACRYTRPPIHTQVTFRNATLPAEVQRGRRQIVARLPSEGHTALILSYFDDGQ